MTVTAPERILSTEDFDSIRARTPDLSGPARRRQPLTRLDLDVAMLVRDRDMLLADLAAEAEQYNALAEKLRSVCDKAPEPMVLSGDEQPSVHASPRGFDYLSHRAVLEMLARDIADGTVYGDEGLTDTMRDRGELLRARAVTARRLLEAQEATIALYLDCAAHGVEVPR